VGGFSPRMRWDLVVNTFTRDAFFKKKLNVYAGGDNWRPLIDVNDAAEAHIHALFLPDEKKIRGQVFNLAYKNFRILDLAHWIKHILRERIDEVQVDVLFMGKETRSYRVCTKKVEEVLGFKPSVTIQESVFSILDVLESGKYTDFENPIYYNIEWMKLLSDMEQRLKEIGGVF
jgi:nucleoside-diphosphate-sugar epimerase